MMIILGIDPGSRKAGYAFLEFERKRFKKLESGVLRFKTNQDFSSRLAEIYEKTKFLLEIRKPDVVAMESLVFVKGTTSILKLAQARGAMCAALAEHCSVHEYSPNLVKSVTTGYGHASKEGMQKILNASLGTTNFSTDDESDALGIALCHALQGSGTISPQRKSRSRSLKNSLSHKWSKELNN